MSDKNKFQTQVGSHSKSAILGDTFCCGKEMDVTGLTYGNGWICKMCGHTKYDVASVKMGGNYEPYLFEF